MKCTVVLLVIFGVNHWISVRCSIVKINETALASLPPLFSLEEWARCRRTDDLYCLVDAELSSRDPSELMDLLQEYSQQRTKHYDRRQIHRGVCVTRCTGQLFEDKEVPAEYFTQINSCINETIALEYGLQTSVLSVGWCSSAEGGARAGGGVDTSWGGRVMTGAVMTSLCAVCVLATLLHVLGARYAKNNVITSSKYLLSFSLKSNWEILTNDRSKSTSGDERMKHLGCLEGIRVVAIHCVIFSHVLFMYIYSYTDNPDYVEHIYDSFGWQVMLNSPLWLQGFFCMSAFLTTYSALIYAERRPYRLLDSLVSIASRWIRLTPAAVFALWFTMWYFPALGDGPQWGWLVGREAQDCRLRWGTHLLYTHNHLPLGKFCMGHTWYLAVDMQLHVLGALLLAVLLRGRGGRGGRRGRGAGEGEGRRAGVAWSVTLGALFAGSMVAAGAVTYIYDLEPIITAQAPEALRSLFADSVQMSQLYLPCYMNLAGYVCGMAVAFILYRNQKKGVKLADNKLFVSAFHMSLLLGSAVVMAGTVALRDGGAGLAGVAGVAEGAGGRAWRALHAAGDRAAVAVAFALFMLGCLAECPSVFRSILNWRGFLPLGRLSYCAFLIHFIVLRLTLAADTRLHHMSLLACLTLFMTTSILTYIASLPIYLIVELPFIQLWKALVVRDKPPTSRVVPANLSVIEIDRDKPFDLVANVNIRHI